MKIIYLSLITLLLGACSTSYIPKQTEFQPPKKWRTLAASQKSDAVQPTLNVWTHFGDTELLNLQTQAIARNRDLRVAQYRVQKAKLALNLSKLDKELRPDLGFNSSVTKDLSNGKVSHNYNSSLSLKYDADLWGRLSSLTQVQLAQLNMADTDALAVESLIRSQVAETAWSLAALEQEKTLLNLQIENTATILNLTRLRVQEGKLLALEVGTVEANLKSLLASQARINQEQLKQKLSLEILFDDSSLNLPLTTSLPPNNLNDFPFGTPAEVLNRRADVMRARFSVDEALAQHSSAIASSYPQLSFNSEFSVNGNTLRDWLDKPISNLTANLLIPLIDWKRLDLQKEQTRNNVEIAAVQLRDTIHKALVEIEQLIAERDVLNTELQALENNLIAISSTDHINQMRFEVGAISRLDLMKFRNNLLVSKREIVQHRMKLSSNFIKLVNALSI